jgi:hypothetical protein
MMSPQERHTIVRVLSGTRCGRSTVGIEGMCDSMKQAGALPNSQPPMPGTGPLSVVSQRKTDLDNCELRSNTERRNQEGRHATRRRAVGKSSAARLAVQAHHAW